MSFQQIQDRLSKGLYVGALAFSFAFCLLILENNASQAALSHSHSRMLYSSPSSSFSSAQPHPMPMTPGHVSRPRSHGQPQPQPFHQNHRRFNWFPLFFNLEEELAMTYFHPLFIEEEEDINELSTPPPSPAPPLPHSLIIEERCGSFITIDWPESGILYEPGEPAPCP